MKQLGIWFRIAFAIFMVASASLGFAQGNSSPEQLFNEYKAAQVKKDVPKMLSLVLFQSGGAAEKASWRNDFESQKRRQVKVTLVPLTDYAVMLSPEARKRIRPSITLVKWLVVEDTSNDKSSQQSSLYPIGEENGKFFIVGP